MIWAALLVGVLIGILFMHSIDWIALDPTEYRQRLERDNAELKKEAAMLRAQLEALEHLAGQGVADASGCEQHDAD